LSSGVARLPVAIGLRKFAEADETRGFCPSVDLMEGFLAAAQMMCIVVIWLSVL